MNNIIHITVNGSMGRRKGVRYSSEGATEFSKGSMLRRLKFYGMKGACKLLKPLSDGVVVTITACYVFICICIYPFMVTFLLLRERY